MIREIDDQISNVAALAEEMIATLMGDNIDARKKYITANANFNKVDAFEARSIKKWEKMTFSINM